MTLQNADAESLEFSSSSLELATGTMFGHFRLEIPIGRGGMGAVYRAFDTSLERRVAVKVMKPGDSITETQIANMLREAVAQARLNHPNVVTIYYVGRHREEPFLAMELVDGPTIADKIKSGAIDYGEAIRIAIQVVDALEHANHFGIIHADIKPNNLLMGQDGLVKLSDFGLARMSEVDSSGHPIAGTPAYLAPELIDGEPVSIQSDMYALGVTLFEMVFGKLPFQLSGSTLKEKLCSHKTALVDFPNPWPKHIPIEFTNLIQRMLAKEPSKRFNHFGELRQALKAIQPAPTTIAGISARAMAYSIDQALLLLGIAPFAAIVFYLETRPSGDDWIAPLVALLSLVVPAIYLYLMRKGISSFGRYLFQLRICEQNGLPPGREQLLTREIIRSSAAWLLPLGAYFSVYYPPALVLALRIVAVLMVAELICLLITRHRRTLHDLLCRSRVVLKLDPPST